LIWRTDPSKGGAISAICTLEDGREEGESILSLAREGTFLYSGRFDGEVNVWDLETRQLVRSLKASTGDVHTLTIGAGVMYAGGKSGRVQVSTLVQPRRISLTERRNSTNTMKVSLRSRRTMV
jgi:di- and tripeptidase